jgi:hypothetical protein
MLNTIDLHPGILYNVYSSITLHLAVLSVLYRNGLSSSHGRLDSRSGGLNLDLLTSHSNTTQRALTPQDWRSTYYNCLNLGKVYENHRIVET